MATFWLSLAARAASAGKPNVVFVLGEPEYKSEQTLPAIATELEQKHGMRTTVLKAEPDPNNPSNIPGLEALAHADLAVFYLRFRLLPKQQVEHIRAYLEAGKPVVGLRTSTHAFSYPKGHELESWNRFGEEVLGAPWIHHYGHDSSTDVSVIPEAAGHPILAGVAQNFHVRSWLYHVLPNHPPRTATLLLQGKSVGPGRGEERDRPLNPVAWTFTHKGGGRVFTTTLGHHEDFQVEAFHTLLINAIHWALGRPIPWRIR